MRHSANWKQDRQEEKHPNHTIVKLQGIKRKKLKAARGRATDITGRKNYIKKTWQELER